MNDALIAAAFLGVGAVMIGMLASLKRHFKTSIGELYVKNFRPTCLDDLRNFVKYSELGNRYVNIYIDFTEINHDETQTSTVVNDTSKAIGDIVDVFCNPERTEVTLLGFGDSQADNSSEVFSLMDYSSCVERETPISAYHSFVDMISGQYVRSYAPAINHSIEMTHTKGSQICFILTAGLPHSCEETLEAILDASWNDVLIIIIGVGSGPFPGVSRYIRRTIGRKFDNISFIQSSMYSTQHEFMGNVLLSLREMLRSFKRDSNRMKGDEGSSTDISDEEYSS